MRAGLAIAAVLVAAACDRVGYASGAVGHRCGNCTVCDANGNVKYNISLLGHYQSKLKSFNAGLNYSSNTVIEAAPCGRVHAASERFWPFSGCPTTAGVCVCNVTGSCDVTGSLTSNWNWDVSTSSKISSLEASPYNISPLLVQNFTSLTCPWRPNSSWTSRLEFYCDPSARGFGTGMPVLASHPLSPGSAPTRPANRSDTVPSTSSPCTVTVQWGTHYVCSPFASPFESGIVSPKGQPIAPPVLSSAVKAGTVRAAAALLRVRDQYARDMLPNTTAPAVMLRTNCSDRIITFQPSNSRLSPFSDVVIDGTAPGQDFGFQNTSCLLNISLALPAESLSSLVARRTIGQSIESVSAHDQLAAALLDESMEHVVMPLHGAKTRDRVTLWVPWIAGLEMLQHVFQGQQSLSKCRNATRVMMPMEHKLPTWHACIDDTSVVLGGDFVRGGGHHAVVRFEDHNMHRLDLVLIGLNSSDLFNLQRPDDLAEAKVTVSSMHASNTVWLLAGVAIVVVMPAPLGPVGPGNLSPAELVAVVMGTVAGILALVGVGFALRRTSCCSWGGGFSLPTTWRRDSAGDRRRGLLTADGTYLPGSKTDLAAGASVGRSGRAAREGSGPGGHPRGVKASEAWAGNHGPRRGRISKVKSGSRGHGIRIAPGGGSGSTSSMLDMWDARRLQPTDSGQPGSAGMYGSVGTPDGAGSAGSQGGFASASGTGRLGGYGSYESAATDGERVIVDRAEGSEPDAMTRGFLEGTGLSAAALRGFAIDDSLSDDYDTE